MVIHALVENAVLHGANPSLTSVMVEVRAYVLTGHLIIDVQDDGVGLSQKSANLGKEEGLENSNIRLREAFGERVWLTVSAQARRGVLSRIVVAIPTIGK
jgi:LytS/YehU family sensor histidine kinase